MDEAGRLVGLNLREADINVGLDELGTWLGELSVQTLDLSKNPRVTGDIASLKGLNLITLSLRGCYRVTGDLKTIGASFQGLQSLNLINCRAITGSVKSLSKLKVRVCRGL